MNLTHHAHSAAAMRGLQPRAPEAKIRKLQRAIITELDYKRRNVSRYDSERVNDAEWICVVDKS